MERTTPFGLIVPENFIQATRDSGYKTLGSALAELVDNAFEAKANRVAIKIERTADGRPEDVRVVVGDNGRGMDGATLRQSLQFGWSSRFNQRNSFGRYGMGLPNASLSHARRIDVWSSVDGETVLATSLDVDDVVGKHATIPPAHAVAMPNFLCLNPVGERRGTTVVWSKCDRLNHRKLGPLVRRLRNEIGRLFRYQLWAGKEIVVNGERVTPFDPLFLRDGTNLVGAAVFGSELRYEVNLPAGLQQPTSMIRVLFSELPVAKWHSLSNVEKNERGIAKNAGVSIVRAGREIDRGWFFMGQKRRENYDDWWRCEVHFQPDLDELFGVTHTKQEIHPTEKLLAILVPDLEQLARDLNVRVRHAFMEVKADESTRESEKLAEKRDRLLEPPKGRSGQSTAVALQGSRGRIAGLEYRLRPGKLPDDSFYEPVIEGNRVTVILNEAHPFVAQFLDAAGDRRAMGEKARRDLELLILAAARTELTLGCTKLAKTWIQKFRKSWSRTLATFLR